MTSQPCIPEFSPAIEPRYTLTLQRTGARLIAFSQALFLLALLGFSAVENYFTNNDTTPIVLGAFYTFNEFTHLGTNVFLHVIVLVNLPMVWIAIVFCGLKKVHTIMLPACVLTAVLLGSTEYDNSFLRTLYIKILFGAGLWLMLASEWFFMTTKKRNTAAA